MKIGEVSRRLGISARRIVEYDRLGLLRPSRDRSGKDRLYTPFDVAQVRRIHELVHVEGFTLRSLRFIGANVPCWRLFRCPTRRSCPAFRRPDVPCFRATAMNRTGSCRGDCRRCFVYLSSGREGRGIIRLLDRPVRMRTKLRQGER